MQWHKKLTSELQQDVDGFSERYGFKGPYQIAELVGAISVCQIRRSMTMAGISEIPAAI